MATKKARSTSKTVVTEFKVQVVDINLRLRNIAGAMAKHLPDTANLQSGDCTVMDGQTQLMNNITTVVIIDAFEPVLLSISNSSGEIQELQCSGLFIFYGQLDSVEVKVATPLAKTRISYLYA